VVFWCSWFLRYAVPTLNSHECDEPASVATFIERDCPNANIPQLPAATENSQPTKSLLAPNAAAVRLDPPRFCARVAQLDRVTASEAEGCGFNSRHAHH